MGKGGGEMRGGIFYMVLSIVRVFISLSPAWFARIPKSSHSSREGRSSREGSS